MLWISSHVDDRSSIVRPIVSEKLESERGKARRAEFSSMSGPKTGLEGGGTN